MSKRTLLICYSFLLFLSSFGQNVDQPNILFIAVDDLRAEAISPDNDVIQIPNIRKLAEESILFENHYVQVPTCGASRYSMLTGRNPKFKEELRNDIIYKKIAKSKSEYKYPETFIEHLKNNNYYTVGIGKISHSADGYVYRYTDEVSELKELPNSWDELFFDAGKWETGWNAFFAYADGSNRQSRKRQVKPYEKAEVSDSGYPDGLTTELALAKLKELKSNKQPFFMGVGFFKPHLPFNAPKKYWDLYDTNEIPLAKNGQQPKNASKGGAYNSGEFNQYQLGEEKAHSAKKLSDYYAKRVKHGYYASVSYIDEQIGKLLNELKALQLEDNTVVIIWGDHGWNLGDKSIWGKHNLFENALNSALIIKIPGAKKKGVNYKGLVASIDLYPTICQIAEINDPYDLAGKSLTSIFEKKAGIHHKKVYSFFGNGASVRTDRYRLTHYKIKDKDFYDLYDLKNDPFETENIAGSKLKIVEDLAKELNEHSILR